MPHDVKDISNVPTNVYGVQECPEGKDASSTRVPLQHTSSHLSFSSKPAQKSQPSPLQTHYAYIDYLRAFGAVAVICIHVLVSFSKQGYVSASAQSLLDIQSLIAIGLFRWAVPIFFMISGSLMLDPVRQMPIKKVLRHIWRVGSVLLFAGMLFSAIELTYTHEVLGTEIIQASFMQVIQGNTWGHLWFLYSLLGLYVLIIPLRYLLTHLSDGQLGCMIALAFSLCFVVPWGFQLYEVETLSFPFACDLIYFVAGLYLTRVKWDVRMAWICGVFSLLVMCVLEFLAVYPPAFMPESPWMFVYSTSLFLIVKRWFAANRVESDELFRSIRFLSRYSFGIYVFHVLFLHIMMYGLGYFIVAYMASGNAAFDMISLQSLLPLYRGVAQGLDVVGSSGVGEFSLYVIFELLCASISLLGSCALTWALRKLPYVDRVL